MRCYLIVVLILFCSSIFAADIKLTADVPTQREDGSALSVSEILEYPIKYGSDPGALSDDYVIKTPELVEATLYDFSPGTYYFAIATTDSDGVTGRFTEPISVAIPYPPNPPSNIKVTVSVQMEFTQ
jgi:hypothetical protein